jgi:heat shock protein HslJ
VSSADDDRCVYGRFGGEIALADELLNCRAMMIITRFWLALVLVASIACSKSPVTPTSTRSSNNSLTLADGNLSGTWRLSSVQPNGQTQQAAPAGASYTLTFADGRLSTRVDCNSCSGTYTRAGETLTAGPSLACTRAACPTMAFENAYTSLLGGEHTVTVSDDGLVLSSVRGVLRFTR